MPGNIAVVRRRADSVSRRRRDEPVVVGLTVLEQHLAGHARCPACSRADQGLRLWRTAVLRAETRRLSGRIAVGGGAARWIGASLAVARRPRRLALRLRRSQIDGAAAGNGVRPGHAWRVARLASAHGLAAGATTCT